jgi:hypothetical protein
LDAGAGADGDPGGDDAGHDAGMVDGDADTSDAGSEGEPARWFASSEPLELALSGPFGDAFRAAHAGEPDGIIPPLRSKDPFAGGVTYASGHEAEQVGPAVLSVRGNSSLQECPFPKLKLAFEVRVTDTTDVFFDIKKIKLGTHCGEEEEVNGNIGRLRNEKAAWREDVVYRLARALGIVTLQTRPAIVEYTDSSAEPAFESPLTRKAFLLEHIDELARRVGATALADPVDCGPDPEARPEADAVLRVKFFHAMVGNWDFQLGPPESNGCGSLVNTEVLVHPDGSLTLVPADFDLSAFVVGEVRNPATNQAEAITSENAEASARSYLSANLAGEASEAIEAMGADYLAHRDELAGIVQASRMDDAGKQAGLLLLAGFFSALKQPEK